MQRTFPDRNIKDLSPGEIGHGIAQFLHGDPRQINPFPSALKDVRMVLSPTTIWPGFSKTPQLMQLVPLVLVARRKSSEPLKYWALSKDANGVSAL